MLTITSSAARCKNLIRAVAAVDDIRKDGRMFLFTTEEKLALSRPESVFEKIWLKLGCGNRAPLDSSENPKWKEKVLCIYSIGFEPLCNPK